MAFFFLVVGAILGGALFEWAGSVIGAALGFLIARTITQEERLGTLERELRELALQWPERIAPGAATPSRAEHAPELTEPIRRASPSERAAAPIAVAATAIPSGETASAPPVADTGATTAVPAPNRAVALLVQFFSTGNVVAKIGAIVLFFGLGFLLKYASQRGLIPLELRLLAVALGAIAVLGIGWRLRAARPQYSAILQGTGVGALYLTIAAAMRLYQLLPSALAFALLFAVVALSGVLAVLQNRQSLAVVGSIGGFLAPILVSTGAGSHIALFSYYGVLNLGIVGIAWYRAWRTLNWIGFVFTFVIATVWGVLRYEPALFATTEPFLVVSFLFYIAVSILFAQRQAPALRGYVDGTLVFGLPAIVFALQSALVREFEFGRAWSAIGMGAIYLVLARLMWPRHAHMRLLAEAFLALGIVFATLAVPFALDGHWTAALWALEGAGLTWIGARQHRVLARSFGAVLQVGAGFAFLALAHAGDTSRFILNAGYFGAMTVAFAGLFSALTYRNARAGLRPWEPAVEIALLAWGWVWWFGAGLVDISEHIGLAHQRAAFGVYLGLSAYLAAEVAQRWNWPALMHACASVPPALALLTLSGLLGAYADGPLLNLGILAWPLAWLMCAILLWRFERVWPRALAQLWHGLTATLVVVWTAWACAWLIDQASLAAIWSASAWGALPAAALYLLLRCGQGWEWPVARHAPDYFGRIAGAWTGWALLWALGACFVAGNPAPLTYLPLLNPLELTQLACLIAALTWWLRVPSYLEISTEMKRTGTRILGAIAFLVANCVVARAVHHYTGTAYDLAALHGSAVFHTALSIFWVLAAASTMAWASRRGARTPWFAGAALLALLVVKLFLIDLGGVGTVARIISFMAAGVVILLIGYLAPAPPGEARAS